MKKAALKTNLRWLRICIIGFVLAILSLFLFSFTVSRQLAEDFWKQLGINAGQGKEQIKNSFIYNSFDYYNARSARNIITGNRAGVAKDLLNYTRQYIGSPAFKTDYDNERTAAKPQAPDKKSVSKESIRAEKIAETKEQMRKTEEVIKTANGELKKTMQDILTMYKTNLEEYQKPDNQFIDLLYQGELMNLENSKKDYENRMKAWELNYPADFKKMIKGRLQSYLNLAATVDFDAVLVEKNGKKRFVKPEYEGKPSDWKMIYRAGKDVYEVARVFASQWMKELE